MDLDEQTASGGAHGQVLSKKKLREIVAQVHPNERLDAEVEAVCSRPSGGVDVACWRAALDESTRMHVFAYAAHMPRHATLLPMTDLARPCR